ncbi:SDR family oxidoreductase [Leucobacter sp. USCH14]|uniref:SDR family NAD(P)-dependent oxidoreductase n=1 Tax=Leucobacter sp. USCH14 TaxID=3024838 RepID=UPI0030B33B9D
MSERGSSPSKGAVQRVVAVTGAASGIGAAIAARLRSDGAEVIGLDTAAAPGVQRFDVSDEQQWGELQRSPGSGLPITGLVHAAGVRARSPLAETSLDDFRRVLDVNAAGTFLALRWAARRDPSQFQNHEFAVVVLSSATVDRRVEHQVAYNASKAAVTALVRSAARELAPFGVRVNGIAPGSIRTPMTEAGWEDPGHSARMRAEIPARRPGTGDEVADAAAFLLGPESSYCFGTVMTVDGGWTA